VKKWLLAILFLVGLCRMDAQSNQLLPTISHGKCHSIGSKNLPPQQVDIADLHFSTGQNNRQQNVDGVFDSRLTPGFYCHYCSTSINQYQTNLGFKDYLLHIYPSHNFW